MNAESQSPLYFLCPETQFVLNVRFVVAQFIAPYLSPIKNETYYNKHIENLGTTNIGTGSLGVPEN